LAVAESGAHVVAVCAWGEQGFPNAVALRIELAASMGVKDRSIVRCVKCGHCNKCPGP
jgi:hypothetical protein